MHLHEKESVRTVPKGPVNLNYASESQTNSDWLGCQRSLKQAAVSPIVRANQSCSAQSWRCGTLLRCAPWRCHTLLGWCTSAGAAAATAQSTPAVRNSSRHPWEATSQKAEHKFEGLIFRACRQVSYWGCFGLFNGPVGNPGWRKELKSYENRVSNNALREIYFTVSLLFIFIHFYIFLFSSFLFIFLYRIKNSCDSTKKS